MKVQNGKANGNFDEFILTERNKFIPIVHVRRARETPHLLSQKIYVSGYLIEFRNIAVVFPTVSGEDKWGKCIEGLKYEIRKEVIKSRVRILEEDLL